MSRFGDYYFDGKLRTLAENPHKGLDIAGEVGEPVLAAADGVVVLSGGWSYGCGSGVIISHRPFEMLTVYCHLTDDSPHKEGPVVRGEVIGRIGRTGTVGASDRSHVHVELHRGARNPVDPEPHIMGCFNPKKSYPTDRLVLTHPVRC